MDSNTKFFYTALSGLILSLILLFSGLFLLFIPAQATNFALQGLASILCAGLIIQTCFNLLRGKITQTPPAKNLGQLTHALHALPSQRSESKKSSFNIAPNIWIKIWLSALGLYAAITLAQSLQTPPIALINDKAPLQLHDHLWQFNTILMALLLFCFGVLIGQTHRAAQKITTAALALTGLGLLTLFMLFPLQLQNSPDALLDHSGLICLSLGWSALLIHFTALTFKRQRKALLAAGLALWSLTLLSFILPAPALLLQQGNFIAACMALGLLTGAFHRHKKVKYQMQA